jgi:hypothetical protein
MMELIGSGWSIPWVNERESASEPWIIVIRAAALRVTDQVKYSVSLCKATAPREKPGRVRRRLRHELDAPPRQQLDERRWEGGGPGVRNVRRRHGHSRQGALNPDTRRKPGCTPRWCSSEEVRRGAAFARQPVPWDETFPGTWR